MHAVSAGAGVHAVSEGAGVHAVLANAGVHAPAAYTEPGPCHMSSLYVGP